MKKENRRFLFLNDLQEINPERLEQYLNQKKRSIKRDVSKAENQLAKNPDSESLAVTFCEKLSELSVYQKDSERETTLESIKSVTTQFRNNEIILSSLARVLYCSFFRQKALTDRKKSAELLTDLEREHPDHPDSVFFACAAQSDFAGSDGALSHRSFESILRRCSRFPGFYDLHLLLVRTLTEVLEPESSELTEQPLLDQLDVLGKELTAEQWDLRQVSEMLADLCSLGSSSNRIVSAQILCQYYQRFSDSAQAVEVCSRGLSAAAAFLMIDEDDHWPVSFLEDLVRSHPESERAAVNYSEYLSDFSFVFSHRCLDNLEKLDSLLSLHPDQEEIAIHFASFLDSVIDSQRSSVPHAREQLQRLLTLFPHSEKVAELAASGFENLHAGQTGSDLLKEDLQIVRGLLLLFPSNRFISYSCDALSEQFADLQKAREKQSPFSRLADSIDDLEEAEVHAAIRTCSRMHEKEPDNERLSEDLAVLIKQEVFNSVPDEQTLFYNRQLEKLSSAFPDSLKIAESFSDVLTESYPLIPTIKHRLLIRFLEDLFQRFPESFDIRYNFFENTARILCEKLPDRIRKKYTEKLLFFHVFWTLSTFNASYYGAALTSVTENGTIQQAVHALELLHHLLSENPRYGVLKESLKAAEPVLADRVIACVLDQDAQQNLLKALIRENPSLENLVKNRIFQSGKELSHESRKKVLAFLSADELPS